MVSYLQLLVLAMAMLVLAALQAGCGVSTSTGLEDEDITGASGTAPRAGAGQTTTAASDAESVKPVSPPAPVAAPPGARGGVLRLGLAHEPLTLDPAEAIDHESILVCENIFDTLVRYADASTAIEPCLAESWETTKDDLTWIFSLRKGVRFQDGTPVTADAVAFSFQRQMDPQHPFKAGESTFWKRLLGAVNELRVIDELRIAIELKRPYAPLLSALAMPQAAIVSPQAVKSLGVAQFARRPVGSGPFQMVDWSAGRSVIVTSNGSYWGTTPVLSGAEFKTVPDPSARLLQVIRGDLDAMEEAAAGELSLAERNGLTVQKMPGMNVVYLAFNAEPLAATETTTSTTAAGGSSSTTATAAATAAPGAEELELSPLRQRTMMAVHSPRVRKALARGIDKTSICSQVYGGLAVPAKTLLPPTLWGHNSALKDYAFDPLVGRQLLEQAGMANNLQIELCTLDRSRSYLPQPRQLAYAVKKSLEQLGIDVRVKLLPFDGLQELVQSRRHDACLMGWTADVGDPDNFLYTLLDEDSIRPDDSNNLSFYSNPLLHFRLLEGQGTTEQMTRERAYVKAQELILKEAPVIPLVHILDTLVTRAGVQNLKLHPMGFRRLATAFLQK